LCRSLDPPIKKRRQSEHHSSEMETVLKEREMSMKEMDAREVIRKTSKNLNKKNRIFIYKINFLKNARNFFFE